MMGLGDVTIELDGEEMVLRPSLKACMTLSRSSNGITSAVQKCLAYDFDTIHQVIAAGLGADSRDLPEKIYRSGLIDLSPKCIRFLHVVANGGKPPADESREETDDPKSQ